MVLGACALLALVGVRSLRGQGYATMSAVLELRIDAANHGLAPISTLVVTRSGTIAVTQIQDFGVRTFTADGRPLGRAGRKGSGPGEFLRLIRLGVSGDTLWAWDAANRRTTLMLPDGAVVGELPFAGVQSTAGAPVASWLAVDGRYRNGDLMVHGIPSGGQPPRWKQLEQVAGLHARITPDGVFKQVIETLPLVPECHPVVLGRPVPRPACADPHESHASDGSGAVVVTTSLKKTSGIFTVIRLGEGGDTLFVKRFPFVGIPISARMKDSIHAVLATRLGGAALAGPMENLELPAVLPPVQRVVLCRDQSIWLAEQAVDQRGNPWLILNARGEPSGRLFVAPTLQIEECQLDAFWGTEADSNDVQDIVRYRIHRN